MTRRATKLNEIRTMHDLVLVLDAGDSLIGDQPYSQQSKGATSVEAMNRLGYDAMALGLKDLSLGEDVLRERMHEAHFPFLSANVRLASTGELFAEPYVVREIGGHRVAIVGATEPGTAKGFQVEDPTEALRRLLPEIASRADIIILVTHTPVSLTRQIIADVPGMDVAVCGGNELLPTGERLEDTLLVHADVASPGHAGRQLGLAVVDFDGAGNLTSFQTEIVVLTATIEEDADMLEWVNQVTQTQSQ